MSNENIFQLPGIMVDAEIKYECVNNGMITPFFPTQIREHGMSYGLSSMGYDFRCNNEFKIFTNVNNSIIDPLDFDENAFVDRVGDECIIPPNSFILTRTIEHVNMPDDVIALCLAKSTLARTGCVLGITPIEPGFKGTVTIEISNTTPLPVRIRAGMGICQMVFFRGNRRPDVTYGDRGGKYQNQVDITLPRA